jgi:hypothetical protein
MSKKNLQKCFLIRDLLGIFTGAFLECSEKILELQDDKKQTTFLG